MRARIGPGSRLSRERSAKPDSRCGGTVTSVREWISQKPSNARSSGQCRRRCLVCSLCAVAKGARRGVLCPQRGQAYPLLIGLSEPPMGFRQVQAIDFREWRGDPPRAEFYRASHSLRPERSPPARSRRSPFSIRPSRPALARSQPAGSKSCLSRPVRRGTPRPRGPRRPSPRLFAPASANSESLFRPRAETNVRRRNSS